MEEIKEIKERLIRLERIIETLSLLFQADLNLEAFMQLVVDMLKELTKAKGAVVELVDGDFMVYRSASGELSKHIGLRLLRTNSLSGLCVSSAHILRCDDIETDPRVDIVACQKVGVRSMICVPLFECGVAVGVLKVMSENVCGFDEHDEQMLSLMGAALGAALGKQVTYEEMDRMHAQLREMALTDGLTGLPNRRHFMDTLSHAIARHRRQYNGLALLFMDLNGFKQINDAYGHEAGDQVLIEFAKRVSGCLRETDMVARLGGDEFVVLVDGIKTLEHAQTLAKKIVATLDTPIPGTAILMTASIGISLYEAKADAAQFLNEADIAMYKIKQNASKNFVQSSR